MQFPVPQFTEVEDKIIGPLTIKQFGIIFGVGVVIFLAYSLTKSFAVAIFLFLLLGLPALGLALVPYNGRPVYTFIGKLIKFVMSPKVLIFHKESQTIATEIKKETPQKENILPPPPQPDKFKEIQSLLAKTESKEREVTGKIH